MSGKRVARCNLRHFLLISTAFSPFDPSTCHAITHDVPSVSTPYKRCMSRAFYTVHAIRHRAFLISPFYPSGWSTTPFVRHEFSTRSSRSSRLDHPLCVACVVVYPSPFSSRFFSFIPFLVEITKCGETAVAY